jgi:predicted nucleic acid-binding protein
MPTSGKRQEDCLVDTSVAVALLVADHEHHGPVAAALQGRRLGLAGHAAFETFSVLTRLPSPARRTAQAVSRLLAAEFPMTRFLNPATAEELLSRLGLLGLSGGSVYDALVAAAAAEHGLTLITRDRRALPTYRTLDVDVELLP